MKLVVQRVSSAKVEVENKIVGKILLFLPGFWSIFLYQIYLRGERYERYGDIRGWRKHLLSESGCPSAVSPRPAGAGEPG